MKTSSPEFRQMQRERILKTKPWLKTKGPVTAEGKARSKMNALKISPEFHSLIKEFELLMRYKKELNSLFDRNITIKMI